MAEPRAVEDSGSEHGAAEHRPIEHRPIEHRAAADVAPSDLGAYQYAARLVLTTDVITASRPRPGALAAVLPWAERLTADLRELFGYTLLASAHHVRVVRRLDTLDPTQQQVFATRSRRPFDRRRLAYLCLVLAAFQRSRVEISLADLVGLLAPGANAIEGLGFDPTITEHKRAVVDVLDWLADRGALRLSDGSAESWAHDTDRGDALYDVDHDRCAVLFRPSRSVRHVTSVAQLLDPVHQDTNKAARREAAARRARRLLVEQPVLHTALLDAETAAALRSVELADGLARLTGLVVERRAEGVMLADPTGRFTDRAFPGYGKAEHRAAGLLLGKICALLEEPEEAARLRRLPVPTAAELQAELAAVIDAAAPDAPGPGPAPGPAPARRSPTGADDDDDRDDDDADDDGADIAVAVAVGGPEAARPWPAPPAAAAGAPPPRLTAPFVPETRLAAMLRELFDELGAASFTAQWQADPDGLLAAALVLLAELGLVHPVPGGLLVLPAAARYRNIQAALPGSARQNAQTVLDLSELMGRQD